MEPVPPRKLVKKKRIVKAAPNISRIVGMWCAALIDQTWFKNGNTKFPLFNWCTLFTVIFKNCTLRWCFTLFSFLFLGPHITKVRIHNQSCLIESVLCLFTCFIFHRTVVFLPISRNQMESMVRNGSYDIIIVCYIGGKKVLNHNLMQVWFNIWAQSLIKKLEPERSAEDDERRITKNMETSTGEHWHFSWGITCVFKHSLAG